ncbi:MAG TPA: hypothetical protein VGD97_05420 [Lacunisphaera sp.]
MHIDAPIIICGIILFSVVAGMPVALLLYSRKQRTKEDVIAISRESPAPYFWWGTGLTTAALALFSIFFFGYLLPGLGWIEKNWLSEIPIRIRRGRHGSEFDPISTPDVDMNLLISSIFLVVLIFGLLLLWQGIKLHRARRSAPEFIR